MIQLTVSDVDAIRDVIDNGGTYVMTIDADDMNMSDDVVDALGNTIKTGFEMPPTSVIYDDASATEILARADGFTAITVRVYRAGGKIVYKRLDDGRFETTITR